MNSLLMRLAVSCVRGWTRLYTWRMPPAFRETRRAEIESDLWEFQSDAGGDHRLGSALHMLFRLLIGIPDDLGWRVEQAALADTLTQEAIALSARVAGAALFIGALWVIHADAVRRRPAIAVAGPAVDLDQEIERTMTMRARNVRRSAMRLPLLTAGIVATVGVSTRPQRVAQSPRIAASSPVFEVASIKPNPTGFAGPTQSQIQSGGRFVATNIPVRLLIGQSYQAPQSNQADRFIAKLLQNRYALSARRGQLSGAGAQVLQSAIAQSRFVLLGEDHGVAQTPEFWAAVCNAAGPERFHTMAVEEGPLVAAELEGWARRPDGLAQLVAFEKTFPESINVYNVREEFDMLQRCARLGQREFRLWGLNQEALGAAGLILSRVLASRVGKEARPAMQQLLQNNDAAYRKAVHSGRIFDLFMIAADDKELASGAALLLKDGSREAQSLFGSLVESHEINRTSPADYGNARRRERLMKTLFAANYTRAASTAAAPLKVLLKLGAYHVYRGLNPVRGSGIGNYVAEFAEGQGAQSLHVRLMAVKGSQPIHPRVGQPAQLRPFNREDEPGSRYLQSMFSNLLQSDWTMFDLRPLRQDLNAPGGAIHSDLATLVFGYDILVVVPEGTPSTEIR
jgi:hypothetical protein